MSYACYMVAQANALDNQPTNTSTTRSQMIFETSLLNMDSFTHPRPQTDENVGALRFSRKLREVRELGGLKILETLEK